MAGDTYRFPRSVNDPRRGAVNSWNTIHHLSRTDWCRAILYPYGATGNVRIHLTFRVVIEDLWIQSFGWMVRQVAELENNMNSVERVVHYAQSLEQEAAHEIADSPASPDWPLQGKIVMKDVVMRYRPELPPVLKGLSMTISPGEKIGVVGRLVSPFVLGSS